MWIKHNHALYNTADIAMIEAKRTNLYAKFLDDGSTKIIGQFRSQTECEEIFKNISSALLFEDDNHPGVIIRDTKEKK